MKWGCVAVILPTIDKGRGALVGLSCGRAPLPLSIVGRITATPPHFTE